MRIYVNWCDENILSPKQYEDLLKEKVKELESDEDAFIEWLDRNYNASDLWNESVPDKELIKAEWRVHCWDEVTYDLSHDYDKYDIEED